MAARNRRNAESISEDVENMSEGNGMAEHKMEKDSERTSMAAMAAFDAINGPIIKALDQNRMIFQKLVHAMQEESLRFVNRRLEHAGRSIENSRECQGVMDIVSVQQEFLMDMARDYAEQTRRFADLIQELAEDGTTGVTKVAIAASEPVQGTFRRMETRSESERGAAA